MRAFEYIYNVPLKGRLSSVPSCFINSYLTPLLISSHPIRYSFRYGIDEILDL